MNWMRKDTLQLVLIFALAFFVGREFDIRWRPAEASVQGNDAVPSTDYSIDPATALDEVIRCTDATHELSAIKVDDGGNPVYIFKCMERRLAL